MKPFSRSQQDAGVGGATGAIDPGVLYRLDEAKSRMGWRDAAFRAAVRAGLPIHRSGKRVFIRGADLVAFVTKGEAGR